MDSQQHRGRQIEHQSSALSVVYPHLWRDEGGVPVPVMPSDEQVQRMVQYQQEYQQQLQQQEQQQQQLQEQQQQQQQQQEEEEQARKQRLLARLSGSSQNNSNYGRLQVQQLLPTIYSRPVTPEITTTAPTVRTASPSPSPASASPPTQKNQNQNERKQHLTVPSPTLPPPALSSSSPVPSFLSPTSTSHTKQKQQQQRTNTTAYASHRNKFGLFPRDTKHIPPWWLSALGFALVVGAGVAALFIAGRALRDVGADDVVDTRWLALSMASSGVAIVASFLCIGIIVLSRLRCIMHRAFLAALCPGFVMVLLWIIPFTASVNTDSSISTYAASPLGQAVLINVAASVVYVLTLVWANPTRFSGDVAGLAGGLVYHQNQQQQQQMVQKEGQKEGQCHEDVWYLSSEKLAATTVGSSENVNPSSPSLSSSSSSSPKMEINEPQQHQHQHIEDEDNNTTTTKKELENNRKTMLAMCRDEGDVALGELPVGYGREYWARATEQV